MSIQPNNESPDRLDNFLDSLERAAKVVDRLADVVEKSHEKITTSAEKVIERQASLDKERKQKELKPPFLSLAFCGVVILTSCLYIDDNLSPFQSKIVTPIAATVYAIYAWSVIFKK